MDKQINNNDIRERAFQENVIRVFLKTVITNCDIEPVDVKINTTTHDYLQYCGTYINNRGEKVPATPDLCIADVWNWDNKNNKVNYRAVVEVKSPIRDPITGFSPEKYKCIEEISRHLNGHSNDKVILTDGVTWAFYRKEYGTRPVHEPVVLGEMIYRYKNNGRKNPGLERNSSGDPIVDHIKWKKGKRNVVDDEVIRELFEKPLIYDEDPYEYKLLKQQLLEFIFDD